MKRTGRLWERILERENLRLAFHRASSGKRDRAGVREFGESLDRNLETMTAQIRDGTFPIGRCHQFMIHDPKRRVITAPCFVERVFHHAIIQIAEPTFEQWLISDTYACRVGKGRIAALQRARGFARGQGHFLKMDIRSYFDSIRHDRLLEGLERHFRDTELLSWFSRMVCAFRGTSGMGLPIGSLTSQHFANFYLGHYDRFVKESLRIRGYIRYMDDMALWSDSSAELAEVLERSREFLRVHLGLKLKPGYHINRTEHGMDFLGCRVFQHHTIPNRVTRVRFRRRFAKWESREEWERVGSLFASIQTAGVSSWQFRRSVLERSVVSDH